MPLRRLLLFASGLLAGAAAFAAASPQTWDDIVAAAREAEARFEVARALELYLEADRLRPDDPVTLQKIAQRYQRTKVLSATTGERKTLGEFVTRYREFWLRQPLELYEAACAALQEHYDKMGKEAA